MLCATCLADYPNQLPSCPRCRKPPATAETSPSATPPTPSKVLEFPAPADTRPQWRQEASARFRAYQEQKGRLQGKNGAARTAGDTTATNRKSGNVVSLPQRAAMDERVARALERVERAKQTAPDFTAQQSTSISTPPESVVPETPETYPSVPPVAPPLSNVPQPLPIPQIVDDAAVTSSGWAHGLRLPVTIVEKKNSSATTAPTAVANPATPTITTFTAQAAPKPTRPVTAPPTVAQPAPQPLPTLRVVPSPAPRPSSPPLVLRAVPPTTPTTEDFADAATETEAATTIAAEVTPENVPTPAPRLLQVKIADDLDPDSDEATEETTKRRDWRKMLAVVGQTGDLAPLALRAVAAGVDWLLALVASLPLLLIAINYSADWRWSSLALLVVGNMVAFMGLYATFLTRYAGRTWGQELLFLHVAQVEDGTRPTLQQCALRTLAYLAWPLTCGGGLLYALWDAEGRAWHDKFSGTIVLRS